MALPIQYPLVNGHRYSFVSIEALFNGIPMIGFTEVNYGPSLKGSLVYGSRPQPIGRTRGKLELKFSFKMYRLEFEILKASLGAAGVGFGETAFDTGIQYAEAGQPIITDSIIAARIEDPDLSNSEGTDASMVNVTCSCMNILLAGVPIVTPSAPIGI